MTDPVVLSENSELTVASRFVFKSQTTKRPEDKELILDDFKFVDIERALRTGSLEKSDSTRYDSANDGLFVSPHGQPYRGRKFTWHRFGQTPVLLKKPNNLSYIKPGEIQNCSFLSIVNCLMRYYHQTSDAQLIKQLIRPVDPDTDIDSVIFPSRIGKYLISVWMNGEQRGLVVDDIYPTVKSEKTEVSSSYVFCAHINELQESWVSLLEKAYLYTHGGSDKLCGSSPSADIFNICGWFAEIIPLRNPVFKERHMKSGTIMENVTTDIKVYRHNHSLSDSESSKKHTKGVLDTHKGIVVVGTRELPDATLYMGSSNEAVSQSTRLVSKHAYSLLRIVEVPASAHYSRGMLEKHQKIYRFKSCVSDWSVVPNCISLALLMNPWGMVTASLPFGNRDLIWEDPQWSVCGLDIGSLYGSGYFWILWEDIVGWFSNIYIGHDLKATPAILHENLVYSDESIEQGIKYLPAHSQFLSELKPTIIVKIANPEIQQRTGPIAYLVVRKHVKSPGPETADIFLGLMLRGNNFHGAFTNNEQLTFVLEPKHFVGVHDLTFSANLIQYHDWTTNCYSVMCYFVVPVHRPQLIIQQPLWSGLTRYLTTTALSRPEPTEVFECPYISLLRSISGVSLINPTYEPTVINFWVEFEQKHQVDIFVIEGAQISLKVFKQQCIYKINKTAKEVSGTFTWSGQGVISIIVRGPSSTLRLCADRLFKIRQLVSPLSESFPLESMPLGSLKKDNDRYISEPFTVRREAEGTCVVTLDKNIGMKWSEILLGVDGYIEGDDGSIQNCQLKHASLRSSGFTYILTHTGLVIWQNLTLKASVSYNIIVTGTKLIRHARASLRVLELFTNVKKTLPCRVINAESSRPARSADQSFTS